MAFNPKDKSAAMQDYRLPDGEVISVGAEAYQAPEILGLNGWVEISGVHMSCSTLRIIVPRDKNSFRLVNYVRVVVLSLRVVSFVKRCDRDLRAFSTSKLFFQAVCHKMYSSQYKCKACYDANAYHITLYFTLIWVDNVSWIRRSAPE